MTSSDDGPVPGHAARFGPVARQADGMGRHGAAAGPAPGR